MPIQQTPQEREIRIGIVGTNFVSDWMAQAIATLPGVRAEAVYSRTMEKGTAFAKKHGISQVFTDFEAFCKADDLDAVYIASPNFAHCAQAVQAAQCKKHILCEKVIATNTREFERMRAAALENKVVLMEAMRPAYDPALELVKQQLASIGPLRRVVLEYCQYSSRYDRFKAGEVLNAFDPALSNAAIMDIGVYCIHCCVQLFGMPKTLQAQSVFLPNGFEGSGTILAQYPGFLAEIIYSKITESVFPSVFQGEGGSITVDKLSMPKAVTRYPRGGQVQPLEYQPAENNMVYELQAFLQAVRAEQYRHPRLECSAMELAVIDEARRQTGIRFPADA